MQIQTQYKQQMQIKYKYRYKYKYKSPAMNIDAPFRHWGESAVANKFGTSVLSRPGRTMESDDDNDDHDEEYDDDNDDDGDWWWGGRCLGNAEIDTFFSEMGLPI